MGSLTQMSTRRLVTTPSRVNLLQIYTRYSEPMKGASVSLLLILHLKINLLPKYKRN